MENSGLRGLSPLVLNEFGINTTDIKRDKAGYICRTDKQVIFVQKSRARRDTLGFAHYVKEGLHSAGFIEIDRFMTRANGLPYYELESDIYTVTRYIDGYETSFDRPDAVCALAEAAGRMYNIISRPDFFNDYNGTVPAHREKAFAAPDGFLKQLRQLRGYKKNLQRQGRLSDFDVLFLKHFDNYEKRMLCCMELVDSHGISGELSLGCFTHNLLKEETVITKDGKIYITGFDECSSGHFLFDLAAIIKRHIKTAAGKDSYALGEVLMAYNKEKPLKLKDIKALYAILLYPDKFYKTCVNYYSKKRTWTPASFKTVLEDITSRSDEDFRYLDVFFESHINANH